MKIAIAQVNTVIGDFEGIEARYMAAIDRAEARGAELVILPELATTGYPPRDMLYRAGFVERNLALKNRLVARSTENMGLLFGCVLPHVGAGKPLFNAAILAHRGETIGRYHKCLLPTYDVFDEDRYFMPGGSALPLYFKGIALGVSICEDLWNDQLYLGQRLYTRDPIDETARAGARLLINLSASPYDLTKAALRHSLLKEKAKTHGRYMLYANQVGGQDELLFDGHSVIVDPTGEVVCRGRCFEDDLLVYDIPPESLAPNATPEPGALCQQPPEPQSPGEAAYLALCMGLRDYVTKTGFSKVIIALSGGVDSALVAALAVHALGPDNVLTVALPARYSSDHSLSDAAHLAKNLGNEHQTIEIDPIFEAYLTQVEAGTGTRPSGLAEENYQSRIRGDIVMGLSNQLGRLVLTTGNKSELAVGYCTLYGDMSGALAVISDVPKTLVYEVCEYINREKEIIPRNILTKAPSAELRPDQKDEDSLPPYDILDPIIKGYIEEDKGLEDLAEEGFDRETVAYIIRLIDRNEFKRWQAAPGLRITAKAFGVGRRYPLAVHYPKF